MKELHTRLEQLRMPNHTEKAWVVNELQQYAEAAGYEIVEVNEDKPWGAYIRIHNSQADEFVAEFFPGLTPEQARLGRPEAELSPKFLLVSPGQRLSWQYHNRRAERWTFLTDGAYNKSMTDEPGETIPAAKGDVVQFAAAERHRLIGLDDRFTLVAEIWQHTDEELSNENDIVRLADDYAR